MTFGQRPEAIDARVVLRAYAWIAIVGGMFIYSWPPLLPSAQFPQATRCWGSAKRPSRHTSVTCCQGFASRAADKPLQALKRGLVALEDLA